MYKSVLDGFFKSIPGTSFSVNYWDGDTRTYGNGQSLVKICLRDRQVAQQLLKEPTLGFGEGYMMGSIQVLGSLEEVVKLAHNANLIERRTLKKALVKGLRLMAGGKQSKDQQKNDVQYHYDLGNDFFNLWLDETMSYSCAYFKTPEDTLHQAQLQKIDHILSKLQLQPGENLLDIGCGWGWLVIKAVQEYGVEALGITLSEEQYREANRRITILGLTGRARVDLLDYRDLPAKGQTFDKIASIGMLEHVGQSNLPLFIKTVEHLLKPGGLMLLHTITSAKEASVNPWTRKYIFPGGYIPSLRELVALLPEHDFNIIDIESLRLHYAKTLDCWSDAFEARIKEIEEKFGQNFVRMWRLYLQGSAASFRHRGLDVYQILFSKGLNNNLKLTRKHLYP
ncbi:MAG: SAM-dependent methyltransferase [Desulfosporosinus sp. BRH_c37]|nr:MAG: SAM-dependent methyltransferase [Desulfosporosinus sp. BRH_c37]